MKAKKILTTAVAGTLVAAQMAMPVMADGGSLDVDVTTKTGVLRVQVPTTMAIAVDQFEIAHTGSQIAAGEFDMTNLSEMDVKVKVTSTATLGTGVSLVSTAEAAENSTKSEAWIGVAAKTGVGSYADGEASDFWELTDVNANVTSFKGGTKKAEQTFYLEKSAGTAEYKLAVPDAATQVDKTFAQFYELEELTLASNDDAGLQAAVDANDVYVVATANVGNDGETVTKLAKGTSSVTYAGTNTYYKAADVASAPATGKVYVYAGMNADGGKAGFTYIGKLSGGKETWTNTDISKVKIAYDITGITGTNYDEVKDDCVYGFYGVESGPQAVLSASGLITVSGLADGETKLTVTSASVKADGVDDTALNSKSSTWNVTDAEAKIQLSSAWVDLLNGKSATVTVNLSDNTTITTTATIAK